jgi:hypothetical protein
MTTQVRYESKTPFSLWLRNQPEIDSKLGYNTTDADYIWSDGLFYMLIEEKRYMKPITYKQKQLYLLLHNNCKNDIIYKGTHLIQFEKTNPDDGDIYIDYIKVNRDDLIKWLRFELDNTMYDTIVFNKY